MKLTAPATRGNSAAEATARPYRVLDPLDETGRMTLAAPDGTERTVVDCVDELVGDRLSERDRGAVVRLELSPVADGEGYVAARVLTGSAPLP